MLDIQLDDIEAVVESNGHSTMKLYIIIAKYLGIIQPIYTNIGNSLRQHAIGYLYIYIYIHIE